MKNAFILFIDTLEISWLVIRHAVAGMERKEIARLMRWPNAPMKER